MSSKTCGCTHCQVPVCGNTASMPSLTHHNDDGDDTDIGALSFLGTTRLGGGRESHRRLEVAIAEERREEMGRTYLGNIRSMLALAGEVLIQKDLVNSAVQAVVYIHMPETLAWCSGRRKKAGLCMSTLRPPPPRWYYSKGRSER